MLIAPGDALHEAAHIALAPPERRFADFAFIEGEMGGEELTTIAWCWAALLELEIKPEDSFDDTACKRGDSPTIIDCARRGIYIGFPLLQAWEMAFDEPNARLRGVDPFPHMVKMGPRVNAQFWSSLITSCNKSGNANQPRVTATP